MKRRIKRDVPGGARTRAGKVPPEQMLRWVQTGVMEVAVQDAKGRYFKEFVVLSPAKRISLAKACVKYYARKLPDRVVPSEDD